MNLYSKKIEIAGAIVAGSVVSATVIYYWKKKARSHVLNSRQLWPYDTYSHESKILSQSVKIITKVGDFDDVTVHQLEEDLKQVKLLGIDCEWITQNGKSKDVALLQIASVSGVCLLIHFCQYDSQLPCKIADILSDDSILKVGVGTIEDAKKLFIDHQIIVNGCVDLRGMIIGDPSIKSYSLKGLALKYLNVTLDKSKNIQCSNWEAEKLSVEQVKYAATDALIAVRIFTAIIKEKFAETGRQQSGPWDVCTKQAMWKVVLSCCEDLIDVKFRDAKKMSRRLESIHQSKTTSVPFLKPMKSFTARKGPLYDNCKLQAPDGQLLSTCDRQKAKWYIGKELADVISEDPFVVRLRFEPAGRPTSDCNYYLFDKDNFCVVCGKDGSIVRKNVVPHEYRRHFPLMLKDHVSHDILPLCISCHQRAGHHDCILRRRIADEYNAPLGSKQSVQLLEDSERRSVRSAGRALRGAGHKIPEPRRSHLETVIKEFFQVDNVSVELIEQASNLETRYKNEAYCPHGDKVVESILSKHGLQGLAMFEKRWRKHFLDSMKPKHLPRLWSIEHNHDRVLKTSEANGLKDHAGK